MHALLPAVSRGTFGRYGKRGAYRLKNKVFEVKGIDMEILRRITDFDGTECIAVKLDCEGCEFYLIPNIEMLKVTERKYSLLKHCNAAMGENHVPHVAQHPQLPPANSKERSKWLAAWGHFY
eukprot:gene19148-6448_t